MLLEELRRWIDQTLVPWLHQQQVNELPAYTLEEPPAGIDADIACNLALLLAHPLKKAPRAIAQRAPRRTRYHLRLRL